MRILVTGGAGFIGSNFIRHMLRTHPEHQIVNFDKLTYAGNLENLRDVEQHPNYRFLAGDIASRGDVERAFELGIDWVANFAAESHVDRSIEGPDVFLQTNVLGTQVLLDTARKRWLPSPIAPETILERGERRHLFLQISTDEVYGSLGPEGYFTETTLLSPNSPYSASKAAADLLVRSYHHTYGLPVLITRCSNNYGPYQFPEKLIPLMITNALEGKDLPVYGDGLNVRDWIHVEDHARALDLVLHKGQPGEVYNIGGNSERTNLEIVRFILRELGRPDSLIRFVRDRLGHDRRYAIDSSKIQRNLGWTPLRHLEDGLRATIAWYIENRPWWERIKSGEYRHYYQRMYGGK
ncbi:MAG: dTDP-glucose 4,6-dehydratase [Firmicutes bacterium]|nr:dTDP-glucose 4,6-dehydratase [Bacillota bacterium]MCL5040701.1 dTDP-glucose 4,6-dehydratase [Bacillota bacterium]